MRFLKKHPYLTGQIVGWALIAVAFGVMLVNMDDFNRDPVMAAFVLLLIAGSSVVLITPPAIRLGRRGDAYGKKLTLSSARLYTLKHGGLSAIWALAIIAVFMFSLGALVYCIRYSFLFIFATPLSMYLAAIPYWLYSRHISRWFTMEPHAESRCRVLDIDRAEELSMLERVKTRIYLARADDRTLRFFYNYFSRCGALKREPLRLARVSPDALGKRYGLELAGPDCQILCVTEEDVEFTDEALRCLAFQSAFYDEVIEELKTIALAENADGQGFFTTR